MFGAGAGENLVWMKALITDLQKNLEADAAKHRGALRTPDNIWYPPIFSSMPLSGCRHEKPPSQLSATCRRLQHLGWGANRLNRA